MIAEKGLIVGFWHCLFQSSLLKGLSFKIRASHQFRLPRLTIAIKQCAVKRDSSCVVFCVLREGPAACVSDVSLADSGVLCATMSDDEEERQTVLEAEDETATEANSIYFLSDGTVRPHWFGFEKEKRQSRSVIEKREEREKRRRSWRGMEKWREAR